MTKDEAEQTLNFLKNHGVDADQIVYDILLHDISAALAKAARNRTRETYKFDMRLKKYGHDYKQIIKAKWQHRKLMREISCGNAVQTKRKI